MTVDTNGHELLDRRLLAELREAAEYTRVVNGAPGTSIGIVFEAAVICGVPLFGADSEHDLARIAMAEKGRLALLPARVRPQVTELDDDF